jgi:OOP family OmpA-OmpF porin
VKKVFAAAFLALFSLPAAAQLDTSALYVGGSLGRSHFTNICDNGVPNCKDRDTEWSAFAGLAFSRYLGLEAGYRDFGHADVNGTSYKANAIEADIVGLLPLRGRLGIVARAGVYNGKIKGGGAEEKKYGGTFGWGVQYDFSPQAAMRLEYQRYVKAGGGDLGFRTHLDAVSLGVVFRFQ